MYQTFSDLDNDNSMALTLGKRKRRDHLAEADALAGQSPDDEATAKLQALFRQHFEGTFEPLEAAKTLQTNAITVGNEASSDSVESDWDGLSQEDSEATQIIHHSKPGASRADVPRDELKTFMVRTTPLGP